MPTPVSLTQMVMYWPGSTLRSRAPRSSSHLFAVSIVRTA
jgi:hypothetical protein